MLSISLEQTQAVLLGFSVFPKDEQNLPPLPAVRNNVSDLGLILEDKGIVGISRSNITKILDESNASAIAARLARISKAATDTLIVYYSGHGLIGRSSANAGKLLLAVKDTTDNEADYNALSFEVFQNAILESPAKKKLLIIDCCFSGRALSSLMGSEANILKANLDIEGTYVIASAPANSIAKAPKGDKYTAFSDKLISALREGLDNQKKLSILRNYTSIFVQSF